MVHRVRNAQRHWASLQLLCPRLASSCFGAALVLLATRTRGKCGAVNWYRRGWEVLWLQPVLYLICRQDLWVRVWPTWIGSSEPWMAHICATDLPHSTPAVPYSFLCFSTQSCSWELGTIMQCRGLLGKEENWVKICLVNVSLVWLPAPY